MDKVRMYVIRQLGELPVITGVVETDDFAEFDDMQIYLNERADEIIQCFCKRFPEFKEAKWFKQYVSDYTELKD